MGKMNKYYNVWDLAEEEELYLDCLIKIPRNHGRKSNNGGRRGGPTPTVKVIRADKPGRRCVAWSSDTGWLVFVDDNDDDDDAVSECFIWNRHTKVKLDLPNLDISRSLFSKCVLYCSNDQSQKKEVSFAVYFLMKREYAFISSSPGLKRWRKISYFTRLRYSSISHFSDVVSFNYRNNRQTKRLMAVTDDGVLVTESNPRTKRMLVPGYNDITYERKLVNYRDTTLFLLQRQPGSSWEVWKMDLSLNIWKRYSTEKGEEEEEAGLVFFTSRGYSAAYPRSDKLVPQNCVCYTEEGDNNNLYVFWLVDQTLSVFRNRPNSGFPYCFPNTANSGLIPWLSFLEDTNVTVDEEAIPRCVEESTCCKDISCELMIPLDILNLIVEYLHNLADYANFRAVCKTWREIAPPICWKPPVDSPSSTTTFKSFPWLMTFDNQDNYSCSFLDPECNMRYYLDNNDLYGCKVQYSKDGWLLVTRNTHTIFFYEPFSKTKIDLADLPNFFSTSDGISFSTSPTSPDWVIVVQRRYRPEVICSAYLSSRDKDWVVFRSRTSRYKQNGIFTSSSSLFHDHKFYTLGPDGCLFTIDLRDDALIGWKIRTVDDNNNGSDDEPAISGSSGYLVSCENQLFRVIIGSLGRFVRVYRLKDDDIESDYITWDEVTSIDDYAFFVSETSSFATRATENVHQNSINFPVLAGNGCLSYKLEESEFKSFDGDSLDYCGVYGRKELFAGSTWIRPKVVQAYRY